MVAYKHADMSDDRVYIPNCKTPTVFQNSKGLFVSCLDYKTTAAYKVEFASPHRNIFIRLGQEQGWRPVGSFKHLDGPILHNHVGAVFIYERPAEKKCNRRLYMSFDERFIENGLLIDDLPDLQNVKLYFANRNALYCDEARFIKFEGAQHDPTP